MASHIPVDKNLSDSRSVHSMDAFSANDVAIHAEVDGFDDFETNSMGQPQEHYFKPRGHANASSLQYRSNVSPSLIDSTLYSFSDLSANSEAISEKPKLGLTDSFGILPQSYQRPGSKSRSKVLQSPGLPSNLGQYDQQLFPTGAKVVKNYHSAPTTPIGSDQREPLLSKELAPPLTSSNQKKLNPSSSPLNNITQSLPISPSNSSPIMKRAVSADKVNPLPNDISVVRPQTGTVVATGITDDGKDGVGEDKAGNSHDTATKDRDQDDPSIETLLPSQQDEAENISREVTPTPGSVTHSKYTHQKEGPVEGDNLDGSDSVGHRLSESTVSDNHESAQEDVVQCTTHVDSDAAETGSVVSVQQLAEDYLSVEPADFSNSTVPSEPGPLTLPTAASPSLSKANPWNKLPKPVEKVVPLTPKKDQLPSPGKIPAHMTASEPIETSSPAILCNPIPSDFKPVPALLRRDDHQTNSLQGTSEREQDLEEQLAEERKFRSHLEGQLESLSEEYQMALGDRSDLLNKLGRSKAQLDEISEALQRERENNRKVAAEVGDPSSRVVPASASLQNNEEILQQKEANRKIQNSLMREKQKSEKLEEELKEVREALHQTESSVGELEEKIKHNQAELQRKSDESEERLCKLSTLEASYGALEKNKQWLHDQLQEGLKAKLALQEELREAKASNIAQAIKTDQVLQENALLQQQVSDLQKGVLIDKEKLVSQLEEIEAGVLSREDLCSNLLSEKSQLENMVKLKDDMVSKLNGDLGRAQVEKEELQEQMAQESEEKAKWSRKAGDLERESKSLSKKVKDLAHSLETKESECHELEKAKASLQEKLRQSEMECVSRDGIIQTQNEAKDMLQRELDLVNESKEGIVKELEDAKCEVAKLETDVRAALDKCAEKDELLQNSMQASSEGSKNEVMQALLAGKDREIKEKEAVVKSLEEQVGDLVKEFTTLQSDFHAQSGSVNESITEKDRVIAHLSALKEQSEQDLYSLREDSDKLQEKVTQLQHEKARLLGQLEGSVQPEYYQKALQDKTEMLASLNTEKLKYQQDQLKNQGKLNRLEKELRESQKALSVLQTDKKKAEDKLREDIEAVKKDNTHLLGKLKETEEKLHLAQVEMASSRGISDSSRQSNDYVLALRGKCDELRKENQALARSLEEEIEQKREVERASGLVASQLKQNFEVEKKILQEKNREQSFDLERLQGKLKGLQATQATLREHTSTLEASLAEKEATVVRLSGKMQRLEEESETDVQQLKARVASLDCQVNDKEKEVVECRMNVFEEKKKVEQLEQEMERLEAELATKTGELSRLSAEDVSQLKEQVTNLSMEKECLQSDLSYLKSQLLIAKTSADSAKREITDKVSQIEILQRQLAISESQYQQVNDDVKRLKEHMRTSDRLQTAGILSSLKGSGTSEALMGELESIRQRRKMEKGSGSDQPLDASLSSGTEEVDHVSLNQSGKCFFDRNSKNFRFNKGFNLYKAFLYTIYIIHIQYMLYFYS